MPVLDRAGGQAERRGGGLGDRAVLGEGEGVAEVPVGVEAAAAQKPTDGQDTAFTWAVMPLLSTSVPGTSSTGFHAKPSRLTTNAWYFWLLPGAVR